MFRQAGAYAINATIAESDSTGVDFTSLIRAAETLDGAADVFVHAIVTKLSNNSVVEEEDVDPGRTIAIYGVDSLSALELRIWFRNVIGAEVNTFKILGNESIAALSLAVAAKSRYTEALVKESEDWVDLL